MNSKQQKHQESLNTGYSLIFILPTQDSSLFEKKPWDFGVARKKTGDEEGPSRSFPGVLIAVAMPK